MAISIDVTKLYNSSIYQSAKNILDAKTRFRHLQGLNNICHFNYSPCNLKDDL